MNTSLDSGRYSLAKMPNSFDLAESLLRRHSLPLHVFLADQQQERMDLRIQRYEGDLVASPWKLSVYGSLVDHDDYAPARYAVLELYSDHPELSTLTITSQS